MTYDARHTAAFDDACGEREWARFVRVGDLVLDAGAEPGALDCGPHIVAVVKVPA